MRAALCLGSCANSTRLRRWSHQTAPIIIIMGDDSSQAPGGSLIAAVCPVQDWAGSQLCASCSSLFVSAWPETQCLRCIATALLCLKPAGGAEFESPLSFRTKHQSSLGLFECDVHLSSLKRTTSAFSGRPCSLRCRSLESDLSGSLSGTAARARAILLKT